MKNTGIVIAVLIVVFIFLYFTQVGQNLPVDLPFADPYAELRQNIGTWSETQFKEHNYWTILAQDAPDYDTQKLHESLKAFLKGYDLLPTPWQLRSILMDDLLDFYDQRGFVSPLTVRKGQYINA